LVVRSLAEHLRFRSLPCGGHCTAVWRKSECRWCGVALLGTHGGVLMGYSTALVGSVSVGQAFHAFLVWTCHSGCTDVCGAHSFVRSIYGHFTVLTGYSRGSFVPAEKSQRSAARLCSGSTTADGLSDNTTRTVRVCACPAAPTPVPTNLGDTNSPTFAPTMLPTFPGGARHAHSTPTSRRLAAGRMPWLRGESWVLRAPLRMR
jgi:hypothetical protein